MWDVVSKYQLDMSGTTDNTAKLHTLATDIAALASTNKPLPKLSFSEGICAFDAWPNLAYPSLNMVADGQVILKHTGVGDAVTFDGGFNTASQGANYMRFDGFIILPNANSGDGLVLRSIHRSYFDVTVHGAGVPTSANQINSAISMKFCILTEMHPKVPWWNLGMVPLPSANCIGVYISSLDTDTSTPTTDSMFYNPSLEGISFGMVIDRGNGNIIVGGTMEGCTDTGLVTRNVAGANWFYHTWFESNKNWDWVASDKAHDNKVFHPGNVGAMKTNLLGWNNHVIHDWFEGKWGL